MSRGRGKGVLFSLSNIINGYHSLWQLSVSLWSGRQPWCFSQILLEYFTFSSIIAMSTRVVSLPTARTTSLYRRMDLRRPEPFACACKELDLLGNLFPSSDNAFTNGPGWQRHKHFSSPVFWSWQPWGVSGSSLQEGVQVPLHGTLPGTSPLPNVFPFLVSLSHSSTSLPGDTSSQVTFTKILISGFAPGKPNLRQLVPEMILEIETQNRILELVDSQARWQ